MDMEKVDYEELRRRCMATDVIIVESLLFIFVLIIVFTRDIWLTGLAAIGVVGASVIYHYKIKISRYLDFLDEDTPDPEI